MKTWNILRKESEGLDAEIDLALESATIRDIASLKPLVTVTVGNGLIPVDRDPVLRAAISGALAGIRRRNA